MDAAIWGLLIVQVVFNTWIIMKLNALTDILDDRLGQHGALVQLLLSINAWAETTVKSLRNLKD